jgi:GDP-4-dehydro-6-deoxy-D-mannose reductase
MTKLVLTGAGGFVGGHVVARAHQAGLELRPLDGDLRDGPLVERRLAELEPDAIVHLAAPSAADRTRDPWGALADELRMAGNLLSGLRRLGPGRALVVAGSAAQYGMGLDRPLREDDPQAPVSAYGASKRVLEQAVLEPALAGGVRVVVARAFNHVGPGQAGRTPVAEWAEQLAAARSGATTVVRTGDLTVRRDVVDVRDVADAYLALATTEAAHGPVNLCSGVAVTMAEVLETLIDLSGVSVEVERDPGLLRGVDPPSVVGDPSRLRALTGWTPRIALRDSLADVLAACAVPVGGARA